jgi:hypothetical protein
MAGATDQLSRGPGLVIEAAATDVGEKFSQEPPTGCAASSPLIPGCHRMLMAADTGAINEHRDGLLRTLIATHTLTKNI